MKTYFVSDVHLGLQVHDPEGRERRFADFLTSLPEDTEALYLLGDIWALQGLMDRGVKVCFFEGNHDIWTYSYFEELGMVKMAQPAVVEIGGRRFCVGHGDGLGPVPAGYRVLSAVFRSRVTQFLFSLLHPWLAFRFGNGWSKNNRLAHDQEYVFRGKDEPLYKFAEGFAAENKVDCFIFGHYHADVHMTLPSGAEFHVLKDWMHSSPYICVEDGAICISQE